MPSSAKRQASDPEDPRGDGHRVVMRAGGGGVLTLLVLLTVIAAILWGMSYGTAGTLRVHGASGLWQDGYLFHRVLVLATVAGLLFGAYRVPRRRTRWAVDLRPGGIGITEEQRWWAPGGRCLLPWEAVRVISAREVSYREGSDGRTVTRPVLDVYLAREVGGLPGVARAERVSADEVDVDEAGPGAPGSGAGGPGAAGSGGAGADGRVLRVRMGGSGAEYEKAVRALAPLLGSDRPDLFPQGVRVEQWFVPETATDTARDPATDTASTHAPDAVRNAPGVPRTEARPVAGEPVTIDYRVPPLNLLGVIAVSAAVAGGAAYLMSNPFGWGTLAAGLLALALLVPLVPSAVLLAVAVWTLPRSLAPLGVRVGEDGIELVRKKTMRPRATVTTFVPWGRVQAIVARDHFERRSTAENHRSKVVDVFLRGTDPLHPWGVPGVGLRLASVSQKQADSAAVARLVDFPAFRLRLVAPPASDARGRELREALLAGGPRPDRVPRTQLRAALFAFRPDLCHGFRDVWAEQERATE